MTGLLLQTHRLPPAAQKVQKHQLVDSAPPPQPATSLEPPICNATWLSFTPLLLLPRLTARLRNHQLAPPELPAGS